MASREALDLAYMKAAHAFAELSTAKRKKVGAILVSRDGQHIIAEGYNGTPSGFDNSCEEEQYMPHKFSQTEIGDWECTKCCQVFNHTDLSYISFDPCEAKKELVTKPEVLHAESNAITKVARSTMSSEGACLYITYSPCFECAKLIIQAGISRVVYNELYHNIDGIGLLQKAGIECVYLNRLPVS